MNIPLTPEDLEPYYSRLLSFRDFSTLCHACCWNKGMLHLCNFITLSFRLDHNI